MTPIPEEPSQYHNITTLHYTGLDYCWAFKSEMLRTYCICIIVKPQPSPSPLQLHPEISGRGNGELGPEFQCLQLLSYFRAIPQ